MFPLLILLSGFALTFIPIDFPANTPYYFCIDGMDQADVLTCGVGMLLNLSSKAPSDLEVRETHFFLQRQT